MPRKLERCVRKVRRKGVRSPHAVCIAKLFPLRQTSFNSGHKHFWRESNKFTTYNSGHKHKLNKSKRLAMSSGSGHTHKLLIKLKGKR